MNLIATCSAVIQRTLPIKIQDPGSFTIPCTIGDSEMGKSLCDSEANINLMPLSVIKRLSLRELTPTTMTLQMADIKIQNELSHFECLDVEFLNSNFTFKEAVLSLNESSAEKSSVYEENISEINTSSKGLILKELPKHLKYSFLEAGKSKPVIISADLTKQREQKLLDILRKYKGAIAWSIDDLKGINPSFCMHKILLEKYAKSSIEH